jgi:CelD/BcsL family acetyltransferase involved in cellulose biosynthesis
MDVDTSEGCFDDPRWRELLAGDVDRHVFATPEWNRVWWEEFGEGKELFVLNLRGEDGLLAIVPLYRKVENGRRVLRFVGGVDLTDYLGPICATQDREQVADQLVAWLSQTDVEWDEFDAHNMPVPFGFAEFLVERVDRAGLPFTLEQEETSAVLLLPNDWDDYLRGLDSKDRHELRRKRRRIEREHPDAVVRTASKDTLDQDLKMFVEMHRGAEDHKGHFMKPEIATFFDRVARAFAPLGWLRIHLLEVGERPVASTFSFELDGTFYLYNSAYEPDVARLSPGFVLVSELVKNCLERGLERFDFLRGPERYKYQLGAQAVPLNSIRILNG